MKRDSVAIFWAIELNLIFWLAVLGGMFFADRIGAREWREIVKWAAIPGIIIAAILQHWAYYSIYKPSRQDKKTPTP